MAAVEACRTAALGGHAEHCVDCGFVRQAYNSCRNRHCPKCQGLARAQWLAERQAELLPVPYFHVVFTLPASVGDIAFQNKAAVYAILFRAAAETLATIAADPRHLGAKLGMTMVLHTWGQTLQHHPHVHCVVPGGGPSLDGTGRLSSRLLPAGACALAAVPPAVLAGAGERLRGRQAAVLQQSRQPCRTASLRTSSRRTPAPRLGGLRQATIRQPRTGAGLSPPIYPSRCYRQQPAPLARRREGALHLERLPTGRHHQGDDTRCR